MGLIIVSYSGLRYKKAFFENLPIPLPKDTTQIAALAEKMQKDPKDAATQRKIDSLVYSLYGLSKEEICVVDGRA